MHDMTGRVFLFNRVTESVAQYKMLARFQKDPVALGGRASRRAAARQEPCPPDRSRMYIESALVTG